jgi:hypothetical protein
MEHKYILGPKPEGEWKTLAARLGDDLDWQVEAQKGLWEFNFGLTNLADETHFQAYVLAIDQFVRLGYSGAVCLYRGPIVDLLPDEEYKEWLADTEKGDAPHTRRLFAIDSLVEYLHRLGSHFPETIDLFCLLDLEVKSTLAEAAHLLSKERFAHLQLGVIGTDLEIDPQAPLAVCLPSDKLIDFEILDALLKKLSGTPVRIIPEAILNEEWHELDQLIVLENSLSTVGRRMVQGFSAAGGKWIGAEGFEPPTHCSQSSCASQTALCSEPKLSRLQSAAGFVQEIVSNSRNL